MEFPDNMDFNVALLPDFTKWFENIEDKKLQASIILHLSLIEKGFFKHCNGIGPDIFECEIRNHCWIYYFKESKNILIIEGCLDKDRQEVIERVREKYDAY